MAVKVFTREDGIIHYEDGTDWQIEDERLIVLDASMEPLGIFNSWTSAHRGDNLSEVK